MLCHWSSKPSVNLTIWRSCLSTLSDRLFPKPIPAMMLTTCQGMPGSYKTIAQEGLLCVDIQHCRSFLRSILLTSSVFDCLASGVYFPRSVDRISPYTSQQQSITKPTPMADGRKSTICQPSQNIIDKRTRNRLTAPNQSTQREPCASEKS